MIRRPPRSTQSRSSAASDVYKRQVLLDVIELRTSELPSTTRVGASHLVVWCEDRDGGRRDELDARGFEPERQYYEMAIDVGKPFPPARWPRGIRRRGYRPEADERRLYDADEEAFAEHFLFESISPEPVSYTHLTL